MLSLSRIMAFILGILFGFCSGDEVVEVEEAKC